MSTTTANVKNGYYSLGPVGLITFICVTNTNYSKSNVTLFFLPCRTFIVQRLPAWSTITKEGRLNPKKVSVCVFFLQFFLFSSQNNKSINQEND